MAGLVLVQKIRKNQESEIVICFSCWEILAGAKKFSTQFVHFQAFPDMTHKNAGLVHSILPPIVIRKLQKKKGKWRVIFPLLNVFFRTFLAQHVGHHIWAVKTI
jgi:hypothetical protein